MDGLDDLCMDWEEKPEPGIWNKLLHETFAEEVRESLGLTKTQEMICEECDRIKEMLLEKNRKYGDSAIHPVRCFSKASPIEQINVRLDDKLSRLMSGQADEDEDVEDDLMGYLVLKRVALRCTKEG